MSNVICLCCILRAVHVQSTKKNIAVRIFNKNQNMTSFSPICACTECKCNLRQSFHHHTFSGKIRNKRSLILASAAFVTMYTESTAVYYGVDYYAARSNETLVILMTSIRVIPVFTKRLTCTVATPKRMVGDLSVYNGNTAFWIHLHLSNNRAIYSFEPAIMYVGTWLKTIHI